MCTTANRNRYLPSRMRHVGSPLFAVIVCRKFATAAAFSWHLPHHKKMPQRLITGNLENCCTNVKGQRETGLCLKGKPSLLSRPSIVFAQALRDGAL